MKIAISGKGGVGKTTLAGMLARQLASEGKPVLAIDADPDANLASALGVRPERAATIVPIAEMSDLIEERTGAKPGTQGAYFRLNPRVDDIPSRFSLEHEGVRLMVMGTVDRGGGGCACPENVLLKTLMTHLLLQKDDSVILDMEAGVEHLGRGTSENVDAMVVVVEPGQRSVQTAHHVAKLAADLGITRCYVVGNKVRNDADREFIRQYAAPLPVLGFMSYNPAVADADLAGRSPYGDPQLQREVTEIRGRLSELRPTE
ncbi:MAG TPA: carbon monoxide dehydrogenase accessory protein CooC [Chloroflexota bacterium]